MRRIPTSDREEKCALLNGVRRVGQAGRNDEHATRGQFVALAVDIKPDPPLEAVHGDGRVGMVLVHQPSCFEGDDNNAQPGLLGHSLGGMVGAVVRLAPSQRRNVRTTVELDYQGADALALLPSILSFRRLTMIRIQGTASRFFGVSDSLTVRRATRDGLTAELSLSPPRLSSRRRSRAPSPSSPRASAASSRPSTTCLGSISPKRCSR